MYFRDLETPRRDQSSTTYLERDWGCHMLKWDRLSVAQGDSGRFHGGAEKMSSNLKAELAMGQRKKEEGVWRSGRMCVRSINVCQGTVRQPGLWCEGRAGE